MSLVLVIDTAAAHCAVAVFQSDATGGGAALAERREPMLRGHAERLFPLIEAALSEARVAVAALDAIAVCTGPGGFTGARIGVAAARGLALALGAPAVGVDWFAALAEDHAEEHGGAVVVALPAPQGMVHAQRFVDGVARGPVETIAADAVRAAVGETLLGPQAAERGLAPLARAARRRLRAHAVQRPAPLYLRPPDAAPSSIAPPVMLA